MQCKVIETHVHKNPTIYLNGTLMRSEKYVYCETEVAPPMHFLGCAGVYKPESITFPHLTLMHGDDLIIVYPNKRYEYPIYKAIDQGTVIDLRSEPETPNVPSV